MPSQQQIEILKTEKDALLSVLERSKHNFLIELPKQIEDDFYQSLHRKWIRIGNNYLSIAFMFYIGFFLITAGGFLLFVEDLPKIDLIYFGLSYFTPVIAVLFLTMFYSRKVTRQTIQTITLGTCCINIFFNVCFSYIIENPYLHVQASLGIIYLFFLYYMLTGLPLKRLFSTINLAFLLSYVFLSFSNIEISTWMYAVQTFVPNFTFFLFMYIFRNGDRLNFLQSKILDIDHHINRLTQEQLAIMSQQDSLTQLLTRRAFSEIFKEHFAKQQDEQQTSAVLFIDVDHFKKYNDLYGHLQGDKAIVHVAQLLKNSLRSTDAISRYGGEEFVVLLPNTLQYDAIRIAEKLIFQLREDQIQHAASEHNILTMSIGLTSFNHATVDDVERILDTADQALYEAKRQGRNRVYIMQMPENSPNRLNPLHAL